MDDYVCHRICVYVLTVVMHVSNIFYMASGLELVKDEPELKTFSRLQPRYFTCWNFFLQIVYACVALYCDVRTLCSSKKDFTLNKHLRGFRDVLFGAILFPSTLLVFSLFWSLYLLDRDLIFPRFADKALTTTSNHIIHTIILPIVLWEVMYRPRTVPKSHKKYVGHLLFHLALYLSVLVYTYMEYGIWIYPIFTKLYGTIYLPLAFLIIVLITISYYYIQWPLTNIMWGKKVHKKVR